MTGITILFSTCMLLLTCTFTQAQSKPLPQGAIVSNGVLTAKKGYRFLVDISGKHAALHNIKKKVSTASFFCACRGEGGKDNCSIVVQDNKAFCSRSCICSMIAIVQDTAYTVNLKRSVLQLKEKSQKKPTTLLLVKK